MLPFVALLKPVSVSGRALSFFKGHNPATEKPLEVEQLLWEL